jgi:hypothetical protein
MGQKQIQKAWLVAQGVEVAEAGLQKEARTLLSLEARGYTIGWMTRAG